MGDTMMGSSQRQKDIQLQSPEQQQLFSQILQQVGGDAGGLLQNLMQPMSQEDMQSTFQQTYVDPAMQAMQQQIIPGIQQRFADANAGSSSALNQALAQSATDLSTNLGAQFGQFQQQQQGQQLGALSQFLPLLNQQTFQPHFQERQGIAGPLAQGTMQGIGTASAAAISSEKVKENIKDYNKSTEVLKDLTVKQYDFIQEAGGKKDKVGLIAETLPSELTEWINGILHVDLYGLMGLMINTIQDLNKKVLKLEAR